jgi:hypothetical protein
VDPIEAVTIGKFDTLHKSKSVERQLIDQALTDGVSLEMPIRSACKELKIDNLSGLTETFIVSTELLRKFQSYILSEEMVVSVRKTNAVAELALDIGAGMQFGAGLVKALVGRQLPKPDPKFVGVMVKYV